jgi:hypothetical protein
MKYFFVGISLAFKKISSRVIWHGVLFVFFFFVFLIYLVYYSTSSYNYHYIIWCEFFLFSLNFFWVVSWKDNISNTLLYLIINNGG